MARQVGEGQWHWTVYLTGSPQALDNVECVEYEPHPPLRHPVRRVCNKYDFLGPFSLSATGWGTFAISIRVFMKDGRRLDLKHYLHVHRRPRNSYLDKYPSSVTFPQLRLDERP